MVTKLVSANFGLVLELEIDGAYKKVQFSTVIPKGIYNQPDDAMNLLCDFLNEHFGTEYVCYDSATEPVQIKIAKPRKIKATKRVSQNEYNKRVKEIVPQMVEVDTESK